MLIAILIGCALGCSIGVLLANILILKFQGPIFDAIDSVLTIFR